MNLKKFFVIGCLGSIFLVIFIGLILIGSIIGVHNTLNRMNQDVKGGESRYSSALEVCSQKIKGVWEIANQYMDHESETFKEVTKARSGYAAAEKAFKEAEKSGNVEELTQAGSQAVQSALAFNVQIEAYPQLRASETTRENMRNLEEATNEIKTALDDWIIFIEGYNTYSGNFWPGLIRSVLFSSKFPGEIKYFKGSVERLDIDSLNPEKT